MTEFTKPISFEWDKANKDKNWQKHKVSREEIEQIFFDPKKRSYPDPIHSNKEKRGILVGKTITHPILFVVYTIRNQKVRIISARDLNKNKERGLYEKTT